MAKSLLKQAIEDVATRQLVVLGDHPDSARVRRIQDILCAETGTDHEVFQSRKSTQSLSDLRKLSMYLSRRLTGLSQQEVGQLHGCRKHGSVFHAEKRIAELLTMPAEGRLRSLVELVEQRLATTHPGSGRSRTLPDDRLSDVNRLVNQAIHEAVFACQHAGDDQLDEAGNCIAVAKGNLASALEIIEQAEHS